LAALWHLSCLDVGFEKSEISGVQARRFGVNVRRFGNYSRHQGYGVTQADNSRNVRSLVLTVEVEEEDFIILYLASVKFK